MDEALDATRRTTARPSGTNTIADVYGQAYLRVERTGGKRGLTWLVYELEDGTSYSEDAADYFHGPERWFRADVLACELVRGRVLDLGCGVGRHASELMAAGHDLVGLDVSPAAVAIARGRGVDARLGDLFDLPENLGGFDTFLLLGINLALLCSSADCGAVLSHLAVMAKSGARILGSDVSALGAGRGIRFRARFQTGAELGEWSEWGSVQYGTPSEKLHELVRGTGWRVVEYHYPQDTADGSFAVELRLAN
ncbi:Methyltransferase domain-containing protein [Actinopolyspora xinjiangensis]|uniref:Methyltransferase domain-containing protein n=1 Tax=Actinopolyspora xinjiangensis TaxID=405564 RepID=A0A1H0X2W0_9ACTN|nr:class I SAM-dependent methyltransferase [Actinopolyspora xinjiangensis]SDP97298.1 Methyltransferase domain-containing protein [Actinopolyspora xinjiangensis]